MRSPILNSRNTLFASLAEVDSSGRADRGRGYRRAAIRTGLLSTVAVLALAGALQVLGSRAQAEDIDGGDIETVIGTGGGTQTSPWVLGEDLVVGVSSDGTLIISGGGEVSNNVGFIGRNVGSVGTATVTGANSTWTSSGALSVGLDGTGTLTIADGGAVSSSNGRIGFGSAGTGTVTVTGADSTWTNTSNLTVGDFGDGTLTIAHGGAVSNADGVIGESASSTGTVTVAGAGSTWTNSGNLSVGNAGTGTLTIENGGEVSNSQGIIANGAGSAGNVTVTGENSTWTNSAELFVGNLGIGTLTIADGGAVSSTNTSIGASVGGTGTVTVTGTNSTWTISGNLTVGSFGTGTLNIGAAAGNSAAAAGTLDAATIAFGLGTGTLNFNHTGTNYTLASDITGSGTLNHLAGVTNLSGDASGFSGTTTVSGGTLNVNNALGGDLNITGGTIGGSGTLGNLTVASGGTIAPGNSIGTLNVTNIALAAGSTYEVEVNSAGQSDPINATGTATINGGAVKVLAFPDFALGTTYTIITAGGGVTGTFDSASYGTGSIFITPTLTYNANNAFVTLAQTTSFAEVAETPNQIVAAGGADSLAISNAVKNAILVLGSVTEARTAFDALSGEIHASAGTALIEDSRFPREATFNRLRFAFDRVGAGTVDQAGTRSPTALPSGARVSAPGETGTATAMPPPWTGISAASFWAVTRWPGTLSVSA